MALSRSGVGNANGNSKTAAAGGVPCGNVDSSSTHGSEGAKSEVRIIWSPFARCDERQLLTTLGIQGSFGVFC